MNRFISLRPHARSHCQSIPDYVNQGGKPRSDGKQTPLDVADALDRHAQRAAEILASFPPAENEELARTLADIRIVTRLGMYYADKIRGATQLAIHRHASDDNAQQQAIRHLVDAARHWHDYASLALQHHRNPLWTNRVGFVDWKKNYQYTLDDIRIAGGDPASHRLPAAVDVQAEPVNRWNRDPG